MVLQCNFCNNEKHGSVFKALYYIRYSLYLLRSNWSWIIISKYSTNVCWKFLKEYIWSESGSIARVNNIIILNNSFSRSFNSISGALARFTCVIKIVAVVYYPCKMWSFAYHYSFLSISRVRRSHMLLNVQIYMDIGFLELILCHTYFRF